MLGFLQSDEVLEFLSGYGPLGLVAFVLIIALWRLSSPALGQ